MPHTFILFEYDVAHPKGGSSDAKGTYSSLEEAKENASLGLHACEVVEVGDKITSVAFHPGGHFVDFDWYPSRSSYEAAHPPLSEKELAAQRIADLSLPFDQVNAMTTNEQVEVAENVDHPLRGYLVHAENLAEEAQLVLVQGGDLADLQQLARTQSITDRVQAILVEHPLPAIRYALAGGSQVNATSQMKLARDPDVEVRIQLAANYSIGREAVVTLSFDESDAVRYELAQVLEEYSPDLAAQFVFQHNPGFFREALRGVDLEAAYSILDNWDQSLRALLEAVQLVKR